MLEVAWWHTPVTPELRSLRKKDDREFSASLGYTGRHYLKGSKMQTNSVCILIPGERQIA